jgi:hypothetical protein
MLAKLIGALEKARKDHPDEADFDFRRIEEAIWLSRFLPGANATPRLPAANAARDDSEGSRRAAPTKSSKVADRPPTAANSQYLYSSPPNPTPAGSPPLRVPGASPLPDELAIGRALRPLARRVAVGPSRALDEEATAVRSAEMHFPHPVLRVATQAHFEAALVVEDTPSMAVWDAEARRFAWLLTRHHRAFHDVRLWRAKNAPNKEGKSELRIREASSGVWRDPRALRDASGRRLIILLTDGVSKAWRNGLLAHAVCEWGRTNPVVVCQTLGERLWRRTFLGEPSAVVRADAPGVSNARLLVELPWWERVLYEPDADDEASAFRPPLPLPVVTLDPNRLRDWARMLMRPGAQCPAFVIEPGETPKAESVSVQEIDPAARIRAFREMASPQAYELAVFLSVMPLTLPVMRLVQRTMIARPKQEQLAEVLLGGIVMAEPNATGRTPPAPDAIEYEFRPSVREALQASIMRSEVEKTFACVSRYINERVGGGFNFLAWLKSGGDVETEPEAARPFARIARDVLRRLGYVPPLREAEHVKTPEISRTNYPMWNEFFTEREELLSEASVSV